jgi:predicted RNA-binding protein YlxR (DUF448 family)
MVTKPPRQTRRVKFDVRRKEHLVGPKRRSKDELAEDTGFGNEAGGSVRLCIATREERDPDDLIRFVAAPDGSIVPDLGRRLPGRGVWVSAHREAVEQAVKAKAFARSLKRPVNAGSDLPEMVDRLLVRRVIDALSLANKAGQVVYGFDQVDAVVTRNEAKALVHGCDAAAGGRQKLDRKFEAIQRDLGKSPRIVDCLTIQQMSLATGRSNVVHAAVIQGGAAKHFIKEADRLRRYRSSSNVFTTDLPPEIL